MKLTKVHLFIIIVLALILSSYLGKFVVGKEGMTAPPLPPQLQPMDTRDSRSSGGNWATSSRTDPTLNGGSQIGVPKSAIPDGQEDLYILKSQIVPPTSPAGFGNQSFGGGSSGNDNGEKKSKDETSEETPASDKCPPCPACARCPQADFECKKVPNYNKPDDGSMPRPVMADFSQFGM
jgi:hypothetical protein